MGKVKGRSHADTEWLKERAREYAAGDLLSPQAILEKLNESPAAGESPVTIRCLRKWLMEKLTEGTSKEVLYNVSFSDVLYLRGRAYQATADAEINRAHIMERAYWWGLYISAFHIVLRAALAETAADALPPQFIVADLGQWYADLRKIRQLKPKLQVDEDEIEATMKDLDEFEQKYGRDLKLPKETL